MVDYFGTGATFIRFIVYLRYLCVIVSVEGRGQGTWVNKNWMTMLTGYKVVI